MQIESSTFNLHGFTAEKLCNLYSALYKLHSFDPSASTV